MKTSLPVGGAGGGKADLPLLGKGIMDFSFKQEFNPDVAKQ
jgi:hypothetical protein